MDNLKKKTQKYQNKKKKKKKTVSQYKLKLILSYKT